MCKKALQLYPQKHRCDFYRMQLNSYKKRLLWRLAIAAQRHASSKRRSR